MAAVSVCGTVQPGTLAAILGGEDSEHFQSGLAARLLLAAPPELEKRWNDRTPDAATVANFESRIGELLALEHNDGPHGPEPIRLPSADEAAYLIWTHWYDEHAERIAEAESDRVAAALAKAEAVAARLALLITLAGDPGATAIPATAVHRGTTLAGWFADEALRVYELLGSDETPEDRQRRKLVELIRRKGGTVTPRELQQASRLYRTADDAEAAFAELVKAGYGWWDDREPTAKGGRLTRVFRLNDGMGCLRNPHETEGITGFVDVDGVDAAADDDGDGRERGEL